MVRVVRGQGVSVVGLVSILAVAGMALPVVAQDAAPATPAGGALSVSSTISPSRRRAAS